MRRLFGRLLADRRVVGGFFLIVQLVAVMYGLGWISVACFLCNLLKM